jgi:hypothetical protein
MSSSARGMFAIGKLSLFRLAVTAVPRAQVLSKVTVALARLVPYSLTDCDYAIRSFAKPPARPRIGNSDDGRDNPDIGTGSKVVCWCDRHSIPPFHG